MLSNKLYISVIVVLSLLSVNAFSKGEMQIQTIIVTKDKKTGKYKVPTDFPGSASYISPEKIEKIITNDINRLIRDVPGINIQEEDGYGLRPNIGMRGGRNDRSANITLMEDGILTSPAPYAASSAYYFPSAGRIKAIEVRKGSSSIKYGPRTTSGALNLITTPIPSISKGEFTSNIGSDNERNFNFNYGNSFRNFGYLVNFDTQSSNGFKKLDGGGNTGYDIQDFMTKFRFNNDRKSDIYQSVEFKIAMNNEISHETYLGLTFDDFKNSPYRRYKASKLDKMDAEHRQYQMSYYVEPNKKFNANTTIYHNEFQRKWYKLDKVNDGVNGEKSISKIFGDKNESSYLKVFDGTINNVSNSLKIKANNRKYVSEGIQSVFNQDIKISKQKHNLEYGIRHHRDYEDRLQHRDTYKFTDGVLSMTEAGTAGSAGNRIGSARSTSVFLEDEIKIGKLTIIPGARFEHIKLKRKDFSDKDRNAIPTAKINIEDAFIPGIASSYKITPDLAIFSGIHKGFAPPSPGSKANIEESINYELGARFSNKNKFFEAVFFFNDYDNLLGTATSSSGNSGIGDQYNGGEVDSYGIEVATGYVVKKGSVKFPFTASYTYNNSEFKSSFKESGIEEWGDVKSGDKLPYLPEHQFSLSSGIEINKISLSITGKYVDKMRATASQGEIAKNNKIPSHFIADITGFYEFRKDSTVFLAIDNIFDRKYVASLRPAGYRPGKPMTSKIGIKIKF